MSYFLYEIHEGLFGLIAYFLSEHTEDLDNKSRHASGIRVSEKKIELNIFFINFSCKIVIVLFSAMV